MFSNLKIVLLYGPDDTYKNSKRSVLSEYFIISSSNMRSLRNGEPQHHRPAQECDVFAKAMHARRLSKLNLQP